MDADILAIIVITIVLFGGVGAVFYRWQGRERVAFQELSVKGEIHHLGARRRDERAVPLGMELRVRASLRLRKSRGKKAVAIRAIEATLDRRICSRLAHYLDIPVPTRLSTELELPQVLQFPGDVTPPLEMTARYPMNDRLADLYRERINPREVFRRDLQLSPQMLFERRRHAAEEVEKAEEEVTTLIAELGSGVIAGWQRDDGRWFHSESSIARTMMPR